jgi:hypothetical protein
MLTNQVKMDESGDLDVSRLTPLLYGFVNTELLRKSRARPASATATAASAAEMKKQVSEIKKSLGKEPETMVADAVNSSDDDDSDDGDHQSNSKNVFGLNTGQTHLLSGASVLPLQTKEQSELERRQYKPNPTSDLWIQKYLRNKYFNFIDNEGGSDTFFAVIRDALLTQGRTTTILELRKQLSDEVNDEVYRVYREKFAMYHNLSKTQMKETKDIFNEYTDIKRRISSIHDRAQQQLMIAGAKKLVIAHTQKHDEMKYTKLLGGRYDYMKNVRSPDQLKERMMTSLYWPDGWAISTMERVLNMKFIVFSRDSYDAGDIDNVLQCNNGQTADEAIDPIIRKRGVFEPTAYILIGKSSMTGTGTGTARTPRQYNTNELFQLITYKTHGVLSISELPYDIKLLVTTKCLEIQAGVFCMIPQFKLFQRELGIRLDEQPNESLDELLEDLTGSPKRLEFIYTGYCATILFEFEPKRTSGDGCWRENPRDGESPFP